jgi:hypothetical protein
VVKTQRTNEIWRERQWNPARRAPEPHRNVVQALVDDLIAERGLNL